MVALPKELSPEMARLIVERIKGDFAIDLTERHPEAAKLLADFCRRQLTRALLMATDRFNADHTPNPANHKSAK